MPKVSVIVPIYNVDSFLSACLDSLLAQTLKDIEIILVNDGSKDSSPDICDAYAQKDSRVVVIHKKNSGYGHSVNLGIDKANGEFISIIEPDDWIEPDMLDSLYQKAVETGADIVKSDFFRYSTHKNTNKKAGIISDKLENILLNPKDYPSAMNIGPCIWTAIYKKEFLIQNNIRLLETPGASYQDTGLHFKSFLSSNKTVLMSQAFYHYRIDNAASSVKDMKKVFCVCDEWCEIFRWAKEQGMYDSLSGLLCALKYNTYMWNFKRLPPPLQKQFLLRFSKEFRELFDEGVVKKEFFKKKKYSRLMKIIFHPICFWFFYRLKHLPNKLIKNLKG